MFEVPNLAGRVGIVVVSLLVSLFVSLFVGPSNFSEIFSVKWVEEEA